MMRQLLLLFLLSLGIYSCSPSSDEDTTTGSAGSSIPTMPRYEEVLEELEASTWFLSHAFHDIHLEKRENGWYAIAASGRFGGKTENKLIWSANRREYKNLDVESSDEELASFLINAEIGSQLHDPIEGFFFDVLPYYGYDGWEDDVVPMLENLDVLSDTLALALTTAYSQKTESYLTRMEKALWAEESTDWTQKEIGIDSLTRKAREYFEKYLDMLEKYEARNSSIEYPTGMSSNHSKYSKNYFRLLFHLLSDAPLADFQLEEGSYDENSELLASNYLRSCPARALLICSTLDEYMPLLYAQQQGGVRKDVTIICQQLLNGPRFVFKLKEQLGNKALTYPDHFLNQRNKAYFMTPRVHHWGYYPELPDISLADLYDSSRYSAGRFPSFEGGRTVQIEHGGSTLSFTLPEMVNRGHVVMLDLIANNKGREICFTHSASTDETPAGGIVEEHVLNQGLVSTLQWQYQTKSTEPEELLKKVILPYISEEEEVNCSNLLRETLDMYFSTTTYMAKDVSKRYESDEFMKELQAKIPERFILQNVEWLSVMVAWYYDNQMDELADKLIIEKLEKALTEESINQREINEFSTASTHRQLNSLRNLLIEFARPEALVKRIDHQLRKLRTDNDVTKLSVFKKVWGGERLGMLDIMDNMSLVEEYLPEVYEELTTHEEKWEELDYYDEESEDSDMAPPPPLEMPEYDPYYDDIETETPIDG